MAIAFNGLRTDLRDFVLLFLPIHQTRICLLQRILVASDFSETSALAVSYAIEMAEKFNAELHVVNVLETPLPLMVDGIAWLPPEIIEAADKCAASRLERTIPAEARQQLAVTLHLCRGAPFLEIIQYARDPQIDLIVMGTHGRRGAIAHVLLGNVAEKVVRKAPCPVLTIRHPQHEFKMP